MLPLDVADDASRRRPVEEVPLDSWRVVVVQPGPVSTHFGDNAADLGPYDRGAYGGLARALDKAIREQTPNGTRPEAVAQVVVRVATTVARAPASGWAR